MKKPRWTRELVFRDQGRVATEFAVKIPYNLIGPQVRKQRAKLGLSQAQLAERLITAGVKMGKTAVPRIERQERHVSDIEFLALSRFLETSPDVLLPIHDPRVRRDARLMRKGPIPDRPRPGYTKAELRRILPGYAW